MNWHPDPPANRPNDRPIGEAIDAYLRNRGMGSVSDLTRVVAVWPEAVGPAVAAHVLPVAIEDEVLVVEVDRPAWATEVGFLTTTILEQLSAALGGPVATTVKTRVRGRRGLE